MYETLNLVLVVRLSVSSISAFKNPSNSERPISSIDCNPKRLGKISL
jgi:hypothetical protein